MTIVLKQQKELIEFQSTPAWGVTHTQLLLAQSFQHFNPHARVGRDFIIIGISMIYRDFNPHARVGRD